MLFSKATASSAVRGGRKGERRGTRDIKESRGENEEIRRREGDIQLQLVT